MELYRYPKKYGWVNICLFVVMLWCFMMAGLQQADWAGVLFVTVGFGLLAIALLVTRRWYVYQAAYLRRIPLVGDDAKAMLDSFIEEELSG